MKTHSYETLVHVVKVAEVVVQEWREIRPDWPLLFDVWLHCVYVVRAMADVVQERAHLLNLLSEDAVECEAGLEEAHVAWTEPDFAADFGGEGGQLLVVGAHLEVLFVREVLRVDLPVDSSEHLLLI